MNFGLPILDFGLRERKRMNEKSWLLVLSSRFDNRKSKTCPFDTLRAWRDNLAPEVNRQR